jgi:putative membrane protein
MVVPTLPAPLLGLAGAEPVRITLGDVGFDPHPEVWLLMAGVVAVAVYVLRVLEPKAVAAGYGPVTVGQRLWFVLAALGMWAVSDWPVHDVAERYLYAVHMFQHLFLSMLVPAMFLLALPPWLFQLLAPPGGAAHRVLGRLSRPLVAGLLFNGLTALLHWSTLVELSSRSGPLHFGFHLAVFAAGLLMWMPVLSPVAEWRLNPIGQCIYLFMMSVVPTVPGGWLVFAEGVVYRNYDIPQRLWGIDVLSDQQAAGVVMKLMGGFVLWVVIVTIFARWAATEARRDEAERRAAARARAVAAREAAEAETEMAPSDEAGTLTYEQVTAEFSRTPAPTETGP